MKDIFAYIFHSSLLWLRFSLSRCLYGWMEVGHQQKKRVKTCQTAMAGFHETWYIGSARHMCYPQSVATKCTYLKAHLHICSDWLITKANIQSFIWPAVTELGMWVVVHSSITHVFCCC